MFKAENLLSSTSKVKKWRSATEGESQLTVILQVGNNRLTITIMNCANIFDRWDRRSRLINPHPPPVAFHQGIFAAQFLFHVKFC